MTILLPSQWSTNADPNNDELDVNGTDYWVENSGQSWGLTFPTTNTLRFEVRPGDVWTSASFSDPSSKERSEIAEASHYAQGTQLNISYGFEVEPGATNDASWLVAGQIHQTNNDGFSPPFEIDFNGGDTMSISIDEAGNNANSWSAYHTIWTDSAPILRGHTYQMQITADFDPVNGYLHVVRDGVVIVDYHGPLGYSGMGDVYWKEGVYRAAASTDIAMDYSNLSITTGATSTTSPSSGSGSGSGSGASSGSTSPTQPVSTTVSHDFNGDGRSDILIENASGAVVVGEAGASGAETYTHVAALGSEWSFHGAGDFLGQGHSQFLIENTSGAVFVGDVNSGVASYTQVAALGSEWKFVGTGDYLGDGKSDFLIENSAGSVMAGEVGANGQATYTKVAALGSEWNFVGSGDYLGEGHDQFLIENSAGAVFVGDVKSGQTSYTQVAALGSEWKFVGAGDFLGDGKSQFLIENKAGAVVVGEVGANGHATYQTVAGLGTEWKFVGTGDYLGLGHDQFLIQNASGAYVAADVENGQAHYTQLGGLGSEWQFHS